MIVEFIILAAAVDFIIYMLLRYLPKKNDKD